MRKTINRKLYDTSTARLVGSIDNGLSYTDYHFRRAALYRKKTGEYFAHEEGGAATNLAEPAGPQNWIAGQRIVPLTYAQAIEWAEDNLGEAETLQIFGCHGEGGTASLNLQIDRTLKAKLQSEASRRGVTLRALVEDMISRL
ncbi:hypothetical protein ATOBIA_N06040 [Atopobiaceae bacterium P1]|nr:hypothetical protein ATOBIA_N06040 [Atopobiaceae bacterium P1]